MQSVCNLSCGLAGLVDLPMPRKSEQRQSEDGNVTAMQESGVRHHLVCAWCSLVFGLPKPMCQVVRCLAASSKSSSSSSSGSIVPVPSPSCFAVPSPCVLSRLSA